MHIVNLIGQVLQNQGEFKMNLKRPVARSLIVISLILAVLTLNAQASGLDPISIIQQVTETAFSIFLPIVNKSVVTTVSPTPTSIGPTPSFTVSPPGGGIVINHNSIALYDRIPAQYLQAAENLKFMFMDRSVGANIYDGLLCLIRTNLDRQRVQLPAQLRRFQPD